MGKLIFLAIFAAAVLLKQCAARRGGGWHWKRMKCFPDNATKAQCFKDFPNNGAHTKTWLSWLMPREHDDTYVINGTTGLDMTGFVVDRIEQDPKYICQYKDQFVAGIKCLGDYVKSKCPFLPGHVSGKFHKYSEGITYICSKMPEMDSVCLHTHWHSMGPCKEKTYHRMKSDFVHFHHSRNHSSSSNSSSFGGKSSARGGWSRQKNSTGSRWSWRKNNTTGGWKGRKNYTAGYHGWGRNTSDNSSYNAWKSKWSEKYCLFKYEMLTCVKEEVVKCHSQTAHIMHDFMRNMSWPDCQESMVQWDLEALTTKQGSSNCNGEACTAAASHLPFAWLTLLLSAWVMLRAAVCPM